MPVCRFKLPDPAKRLETDREWPAYDAKRGESHAIDRLPIEALNYG